MQDGTKNERQLIMTELEEGWPSLTLTDWYAIRSTLVTASIRGQSGPLPENLKQELISQIKTQGSTLTSHDLHEMHEQIALAKRREQRVDLDIEDCLYGTESYVSTR